MAYEPKNPRQIIIIGGILGIVGIIVVIVLGLTNSSAGPNILKPTPTPSADAIPKGPSMPTFYGFDKLLRFGASNDQIDSLKYAFFKYSKQINKNIPDVTLVEQSIDPVPHDRFSESMTDVMSFNVLIEKVSYRIKLEYTGISAIRMYLRDPKTQRLTFDSGDIDLYQGIGNN